MRRIPAIALALALVAAAGPAALASSGLPSPAIESASPARFENALTITPTTIFRSQLATARRSGVPVLLPASMRVDVSRVFPTGGSRRGSYDLELGAVRGCGGANACFVAAFTAMRGGRLDQRANVSLVGGVRGVFSPLSCGASCSPPSIHFVKSGVRYDIQARVLPSTRAALVALANSALRAGAR